MSVRQFYFVNGKDDAYYLDPNTIIETNNGNTTNNVFLANPQNLGLNKTISIRRHGNQAKLESAIPNFPQPSGDVLFFDVSNASKYQQYEDFIQFLKYKPLKFYQLLPNSFDVFYIDCEVVSIQKGEVSKEDGALHCPIQLQGLSFWKNNVINDKEVEEIVSGGKTYNYTYPYTYESNTFANIEINNSGTIDTGFRFEINDEVEDATLSLFQDNAKYGEIIIGGKYDKIIIDTRDGMQSVYLEYNGSAIANPTSKFILSGNGMYDTPFPKLKVGNNVLTFTFTGQFQEEIHIKWQDIYITR